MFDLPLNLCAATLMLFNSAWPKLHAFAPRELLPPRRRGEGGGEGWGGAPQHVLYRVAN
jgi:hypothetical protein